MRRSKLSRSSGYSLLEQALVLPVILVTVLGAVDVNTVLHSYSTLKEGVHDALRCVYPTDGDCVFTTPDTRGRLFDWYRLQGDMQPPRGTLMDYTGEARWVSLPVYSFQPSARVLDQVFVDVEPSDTQARAVRRPAIGTVNTNVRTASFPWISGSPSSPSFNFKNDRSHKYPATISKDVSVNLSSSSRTGRARFTLRLPGQQGDPNQPALDPNRPCLISAVHNHRNRDPRHAPNFDQGCNFDYQGFPGRGPSDQQEVGAYTFIVLHVKGNGGNSSRSEGGTVSLTIKQDLDGDGDFETSRDLGGEAYTGPGTHNFFPRGAPLSYIADDTKYDGLDIVPEFLLHRAIKVHYGKPARLVFELTDLSGTPEFNVTNITVYAPKYRSMEPAFTCNPGLNPTGVKPSEAAAETGCSVHVSPTKWLVPNQVDITDHSVNLSTEPPFSLGSCIEHAHHAFGILTSWGLIAEDYELVPSDSSDCSDITYSGQCPAIGTGVPGHTINYGVAAAAGSDGRIHSSGAAEQICPAHLASLPAGAVVTGVSWSEQVSAVPNPASFEWTRDHCNRHHPERPEYPQALQAYPKVILGPSTQIGTTPSYTGESRPDDILAAEYGNCAEIFVASRVLDDQSGLPPESLFVGNELELGEHCWESRLRDDATEHGDLDPACYLEVARDYAGEIALDGEPTDACRVFRPGSFEPDSELIVASDVPEGTVPSPCDQVEVLCQRRFAGFDPNVGDAGEIDYDFDYAVQRRGFELVQAALPKAELGCNDQAFCTRLTVSGDLNDESLLLAAGEIDVPLLLLGNSALTVKYRAHRTAEQRYLVSDQ